MKGLSVRNIQYMTTFAGTWPDEPIAQPAAQLPWGHVMVLLDKKLDPVTTNSYAAAAVEYGWTRNVLLNMIMNKTLERAGAAPSKLCAAACCAGFGAGPAGGSKDPYSFEFLGLSGEVAERDLEQALMDRITDTLREMGPSFAFVGRQVHFDVGGDDFYIDLLFFHVEQLRFNCTKRSLSGGTEESDACG